MKSTPNQGALEKMTHTSCLKNNTKEIFRHKFIISSPQFFPISNTLLTKNSLLFGIFHYIWEIQLPTFQRIMSHPQIYFPQNLISNTSNHLFACLKDYETIAITKFDCSMGLFLGDSGFRNDFFFKKIKVWFLFSPLQNPCFLGIQIEK